MIDKYSAVPLYVQIQEDLRNKITSGYYEVGDIIPSEVELVDMYGASRITIRNAVNMLVSEGLLEKQQGKGTFVKNPKVRQSFNTISSWTESMKLRNGKVESKILAMGEIEANDMLCEYGCQDNAEFYYVERVRFLDGVPACYVINYVLKSAAPSLLSFVNDEMISLYALMEKQFGAEYYMAKEHISAFSADAREVKLLGLKKNAPLIHNVRLLYNSDNVLFEIDDSIHRADKYEIEFSMFGRAKG